MQKMAEVMTHEVECCSEQDSIQKVAQMMREHNVGLIPIVEGRQLKGVVTDRDIVLRCVAEGKSLDEPCSTIMSSGEMVCCTPETTTDEAAELMAKHQIRRLPVVESENSRRLIGIVAIGDLAVRQPYVNEAGEALSGISESKSTLH